MKRILVFAAAALALTSCNFIKIDKNALEQMIKDGAITINTDTKKGSKRIEASSTMVTDTYDVDAFDKIQSDIAADVIFTQGEQKLTITVSDNLVEYLKTDVSDGKLYVHFNGVRVRNLENAKIEVSAPEIHSVTMNGAGDVELSGTVVSDSIDLAMNGAGDIVVEDAQVSDKLNIVLNGAGDVKVDKVECGELECSINGAGDVILAGHSGTANITVNGAGDVDAGNFTADVFKGKVNGAGKVYRK